MGNILLLCFYVKYNNGKAVFTNTDVLDNSGYNVSVNEGKVIEHVLLEDVTYRKTLSHGRNISAKHVSSKLKKSLSKLYSPY